MGGDLDWRGSATYKGGAAGKYAVASTTADASYEGGHFTADATLMVDFDEEVGEGDAATEDMASPSAA